MSAIQQLITEHIDIWTAADTEKRSGRGRASGNAGSVYGIKKLRELILELAVRGKLVAQDVNDEPASELLKRIQAEKAKLVAEGKIKKEKPLAPIEDEYKPFKLPNGWQWARLERFVLSISGGGTPSKNNSQFWNGNIPWASVKDLNVEKYLETTQDFITKEGLLAGSKLANKGDVIICTRMGLGKIAIAAIDVAINQDLKALKITTLLNVDYFINFYSTLKIIGSGMTVAGIRQDDLLDYLVPTPPLAEQHRIVKKVDELMALCDQLEAQHSNAAEAHEKLVSHLLDTLTQSQSADDLSANWQRIATHFDTLFTTEASIDALKQTLLQLAVMGKLVPQDANDEPASELLKQIQAEKAKLILEGKLKKAKPFVPIGDEEKLFELAKGWEWVSVQQIFNVISGGSFDISLEKVTGEYIYLKVADMNIDDNEVAITTSSRFINPSKKELNGIIPSNSIIFPKRGGAIATNKKRLVMTDIFVDLNIMAITVPKLMSLQYVYQWLSGIDLAELNTGTSVPQINHQDIYPLAFPLPPLAEQHRIVAKVDVLMALCDQLKTQIHQTNQQQQAIANALVAQAVA